MPDGRQTDRSRLAVAACALAFFTVAQDVQMVISAMPRLGHDLRLAPATAIWLLLAGSITATSLMLPAGRWADASGKRSAFLIAMAGYAVTAMWAAVAPSVVWLLAARAASGAFLALIMVLVLTVAVDAAGPANRAKAIAAVTAAGPLGSMIGPQVAALLIPVLGWRAIFIVTVPLSLLAAAAAWYSVPGDFRLALPRPGWIAEAIALTGAVGGTFGLLRLLPLSMDRAAPAAGLGLLIGAGMIAWLRLPQAHGLLRLVAARRLGAPLAALALMALVAGVIGFVVPYFLLDVVHASLAQAALAFIALAFGQTASSAAGGYLVGRLGVWPVAVAGGVMIAAGMLAMTPADPAWGPTGVALRIALVGIGSGLVASCNQSTVMALAPAHHEAAASAVSGAFRNLCYALGAAAGAVAVSLAPDPLLGLRLGLALGAVGGVLGVVVALRARATMRVVDALDHHPSPHHAHAPVHHVRGLADHSRHAEQLAPAPTPQPVTVAQDA